MFLSLEKGVFGLSKIAQPQLSILSEQTVLRFDVSVDDASEVEVTDGLQELASQRLSNEESTWMNRTSRVFFFSLRSSWRLVGWYSSRKKRCGVSKS